MPLFQYKAVTPAGEVQEGVLESASQPDVIARLQSMGLIPIRAEAAGAAAIIGSGVTQAAPGKKNYFGNGIADTDIALMTRDIATLLRAGLPLDRSLEILLGLAEKQAVFELLNEIRNEVRGGAALSKALDKRRDVFSRFYINMVRAGEASGSMGNVLMRLAEHMERAKELKDSVVSALVYPIILLFVAALSVIVLLMFVVPQFKQIFDQSGKALPWSTQLVLDTASILRNDWPIILGVILASIWLFNRSLNNPKSRRGWDLRFLKMNLVGKLVTKMEMARFSRSLATLITNGVPLLAGLSILRETMGNIIFSEAVEHVSRELKEGRGLSKPMLETQIFPKLAVQMIAVGEETGKLDEMLFQVADVYDREVASTIKRILALIQPVMIMGLACLIGAIIMSLLVAMFGMMDLPT